MNLRLFLKSHRPLALITLLLSGGCARKQRDPFIFPTPPTVAKPIKLALPCVQHVTARTTPQGALVQWRLVTQRVDGQECSGYAIYHITKDHRIQRIPVARVPATTSQYVDTKHQNNRYGYVVRAQFGKAPDIVEGPTSIVAWP